MNTILRALFSTIQPSLASPRIYYLSITFTFFLFLAGFFLSHPHVALADIGVCQNDSYGTYCTSGECDCTPAGDPVGGYLCSCTSPVVNNGYNCNQYQTPPGYCNTGASCGYGYAYSDWYTCDPSLFDGCCVECSPNQSCPATGKYASYVPNGDCGYKYCTPYCYTGGPTNCQACGGGSEPTNTCGTTTGSKTCYHNTNPDGSCVITSQSAYAISCNHTYDTCSNNYSCPNPGGPYDTACQTTVNVHVFRDENHDGNQDAGEANLGGVTVNHSGDINSTNSSGNTSYGGFTSGDFVSITSSLTNPFNGRNYSPTSITHSVTLSNANGGTTLNYAFVPLYHVSGHIFVDYNHNGVEDAEDDNYSGPAITVTLQGVGSDTTDSNGNFTIPGLGVQTGTYTLSISNVPSNYATTTPTSISINVTGDTTKTFGVTHLYDISGRVYNDLDAGHCYNPTTSGCWDSSLSPRVFHNPGGDTNYSDSSTSVKIVGTGVNQTLTQSDGTYDSGQTLKSGTYTVSFTNIPTDYHMTYPKNGPPPSFSVTVGTPGKSIACSTNSYNDATCDGSGDIANLGFGMNNEISHGGGFCTDVRDENTTQQFIPNNATCGTVSGQYFILGNISCVPHTSVYYSGSTSVNFGHGTANVDNWLAGGATPENFTPVNPGIIRFSNSYINTTITDNGIPTTDLSTICTTTNCYLPDNLPSGVYTWNSDVTISGTHVTASNTNVDGIYTFPTNKNYVFVIGDDTHSASITFASKILVPNGSTATFAASNDVLVDPTVGESDLTSTAGDLEGFYTAGNDFVVESAYNEDNRCTDTGGTKDLRFNLIGSVTANANGSGGTFTNQRDLCAVDKSCPTYTTGSGTGGGNGTGGSSTSTQDTNLGLTYILNAPDILKHKNTFWQELAP